MSKRAKAYTPFGAEVKKRIIDKQHSEGYIDQKMIAERFGIKPNFLSQMVTGERPGWEYVPQIAKFLGIDLEKHPQTTLPKS